MASNYICLIRPLNHSYKNRTMQLFKIVLHTYTIVHLIITIVAQPEFNNLFNYYNCFINAFEMFSSAKKEKCVHGNMDYTYLNALFLQN